MVPVILNHLTKSITEVYHKARHNLNMDVKATETLVHFSTDRGPILNSTILHLSEMATTNYSKL